LRNEVAVVRERRKLSGRASRRERIDQGSSLGPSEPEAEQEEDREEKAMVPYDVKTATEHRRQAGEQPMQIKFVAMGLPQTAGSKRAFPFRKRDGRLAVSVTDDNPKSRDWKKAVASAAREAYAGPLLDGPLAVSFVFYRPRCKGHLGKNGVKASAPAFPTTRPDVLKLARAVEDSLTGVIWRDDAQIVAERLYKEFGEPARVEITVEVLNA
jgi:Holliday junction resolvase RusA-like endonuclease